MPPQRMMCPLGQEPRSSTVSTAFTVDMHNSQMSRNENYGASVKVKVVTYVETHIVIRRLFYDETGHAWLCSLVMFKRGDDRERVLANDFAPLAQFW